VPAAVKVPARVEEVRQLDLVEVTSQEQSQIVGDHADR
jgi:hypothetical protein